MTRSSTGRRGLIADPSASASDLLTDGKRRTTANAMTKPQDSDPHLEALLVFTNASAERLLDRSLAELMGEPFGVPVVAGDRAEIELRRAGGAHDVVELRAFASAWGGVPAILVWLRDLTERVEFERQLQSATERYDLVVSGTRDGIWDWDLARGDVFYSAHWNELVGLPDADRTDSVDTWFSRIHPDDVVASARRATAWRWPSSSPPAVLTASWGRTTWVRAAARRIWAVVRVSPSRRPTSDGWPLRRLDQPRWDPGSTVGDDGYVEHRGVAPRLIIRSGGSPGC